MSDFQSNKENESNVDIEWYQNSSWRQLPNWNKNNNSESY